MTAALTLSKLEGAGNDFLVLLDLDGTDVHAGPELARRLCERHRGVGADGLIRGRRGRGGAALSFELWNADGSPAEMSGNGVRCLAQAALATGEVAPGAPFGVETAAGVRTVVVLPGPDGDSAWASVDMGVPVVEGDPARCNVGHGQLRVSMGNPHLVVAGPDPAAVDVAGVGAALSAATPGGCNVEFATLGPGPDEVTMRVWERGVGETQACGTGSCAAAAAFHRWGRVGTSVTVHQPGGAVVVDLRDDGTVVLSGPSRRICDIVVEVPAEVAAP